jgi:protein-S-isoprenylcysteine O-methyltransferase Ste14
VPLIEEFEAVGHWLFRWRSYLPLVSVVLLFWGLAYFDYPLGSHLLDQIWELMCLAISFLGLAVRVSTIGFAASRTSGRNTAHQMAESLNVTGMYSIVRNPLYLGNFLMALGVVAFLRIWWIPLTYVMLFALYYERIIFAEEMFLRRKFGQEYLNWALKTPAFFPRFSLWKAPNRQFAWRKVLRREYHGVIAIIASMFVLEAAGDVSSGHAFHVDAMWQALLPVCVLGYAVLRFLHKRTSVLREERKRCSDDDLRLELHN